MDLNQLKQSCEIVQQTLTPQNVRHVLILGSGWSDIAEAFPVLHEMPFEQLPAMGAPGVAGHKGRLLLAQTGNCQTLMFQGRRHWYEGMGWTPVAFPVFLAKQLGAENVILTNAAGGINPRFAPGDMMIVSDHINHIGNNPLVGPHNPFWGDRFPDQSNMYATKLRACLHMAAKEISHPIHEGVYLATSGPVYETPAEIRMFRMMGADAVGMSTVPEAILANAAGLQVAALSCITNHASGVTDAPLGHEEVLAATSQAMPVMKAILEHVVTKLST